MVAATLSAARAAWTSLRVNARELRLDTTLENGQCFGWRRQPGNEPVWVGVLGAHVLALRQADDDCMFRCVGGPAVAAEDAAAAAAAEAALAKQLRDYFQLDEPLGPLYASWSAADHRMAAVAQAVPGMRVLRQDPVECLFSFICSSNNNIGRIGGMLQSLRAMYGTPIATPDAPLFGAAPQAAAEAEEGEEARYYTFPGVEVLAAASDAELRSLGMGYRADYIRRSAQLVEARGVEWLWGLRSEGRAEVRAQLCELPGVGPKVADCVALFSLDQAELVPVDTHVWQIACRDLDPSLSQCKSLTPTVYERVGSLFRERYGAHCGWAHSLLFAAELPQFRSRLPAELQEEMEAFKAEEKEQKKGDALRRKQAREAKLAAKSEAEEQAAEAEGESAAEEPTPATPAPKKAKRRAPAGGARKARKASSAAEFVD